LGDPQDAQARAKEAPQSPQNFLPESLAAPQAEQIIVVPDRTWVGEA
jgi:hypothetical protein